MKDNFQSLSVKFGTIFSIGLATFYLLTERTSWLLPKPIRCGGWIEQKFVVTDHSAAKIIRQGGRLTFCIQEILQPYSNSMADVWIGVSIYPNLYTQEKLIYSEIQLFVAKDFGNDNFSDEPGDWTTKRRNIYSPNGILLEQDNQPVSSSVKSFLDKESTVQLWKTVQDDIAVNFTRRSITWHRLISENATIIAIAGLILLIIVHAVRSIYKSQFGVQLINKEHQVKATFTDIFKALTSSKEAKNEALKIGMIIFLIVAGWGLFGATSWIKPASFKCKIYTSQQTEETWNICLREILAISSEMNQTTILGVTADNGTITLASDIEFYIADGNNAIKFKDQEGDLALLGYKLYDSKNGLIKRYSSETVSTWNSSLMPQDVKEQLWIDVRDEVSKQYPHTRLSITRKTTRVLGSFAALGGAIFIGLLTYTKAFEIILLGSAKNDAETK